MSEETEEKSGFAKLKNQIIAGAGVALTTLGTMFIDEVKSIVGLGDDEEKIEQVQPVQNNQQQQSNNQQVIINIPEQKPVEKTVIVKEVPAKPVEKPKEKEQEIDW